MSLVFIESFDHYSAAQLGWKWNTIVGILSGTILSAAGRRSTAAFVVSTATARTLQKTVCNASCYVVGFAFKANTAPTAADRGLLQFLDAGTVHLELGISTAGTLAITRGAGVTVLSSYAIALNTGQFYYVEMKAEISNSISAGGVEVRLDGVSIMTLAAGADSQNAGTAQINQILIGATGNIGAEDFRFDDLYMLDTLGTEYKNFMGDVRVDASVISNVGTVASWSPSSAGATMLSMIASAHPDSNVTYMFASAASDTQRFGFSGLVSANGSIYAVQLNLAVAKSDTTSVMQVAGLFFSGSVSGIGSTTTVGNTSYAYVLMITSADASGASWSSNTINKTEFGIKII